MFKVFKIITKIITEKIIYVQLVMELLFFGGINLCLRITVSNLLDGAKLLAIDA